MAVPRLRVEVDYEQLKKAGIDIPKLFAGMGVAAETTERKMKNTERALKAQENAFHRLKASLDPAFAAQQKYTRSVELLDDAFRRKLIKSQEEYNRLLSAAKGQYSQGASGLSRLGGELKSMAGSYLSLAAAVGVFVGVLKTSIREALEAERTYKALEFVVSRNAERIGFSADQLAQFADELGNALAFDDEEIMSAMSALSRFATVNATNIQDLTKLTLDYARVTGQDAVGAAQALGKALDEPGDSMRALKDIGIVLNRVEEDRINLLMESGQEMQAQAIIMDKLRQSIQGYAQVQANDMAGALEKAKVGWLNLAEAIGGVLAKLAVMATYGRGGWQAGMEAPEVPTRRGIVPFAQIRSGQDAVDPAAMEAASRRIIKALDDEGKAAIKASKDFAAATKELGNLKIETLDTSAAVERLNAAFGAEEFSGPDASAYARVQELMADSVSAGEKLAEIQSALNYAVQKKWISEDQAAKALRDQAISLGIIKEKTEDVANEWDDINRGFREAIGAGLHDAATGFFKEMSKGLIDDMPGWLKPFGEALLNATAEWFADIMAKIVKAAIAAKAIKAGEGGGGTSWWQSFMGQMGGGGGGGGMSYGALAGVGIVVAAAALFKHLNDEKRKKTYNTQATYDPSGGQTGAWSMSGNHQTAQAALAGIKGLYDALAQVLRTGTEGLSAVVVRIRGDKKAFEALVEGQLIGTYKTLEEAMIAGVRTVFLAGGKQIDESVRQVLQNFETNDPEKFMAAVQRVQSLVDLTTGLDELGNTIMGILPSVQSLISELENYGLAAEQVARLSGAFALDQFRQQWNQLSGYQMSPAEQKKIAEANRRILLSQLNLYKLELQGKLNALKVNATAVKAQAQLYAIDIWSGDKYLRQRAKQMGLEAELRAEYIATQGYLNEEQAKIYNDLLEQTQQLINEVSTGTIRVGRGRRGRGGGGGMSYQDRLVSAIERLINAVTALREFQESLKQDEQLSPYGTAARFAMARNSFNTLAQQAMAGNVSAIENLPEAARLYLELAQQMYGRAGAGYGNIFEQVQALLQAISDQYPEGQDPQAWLRSDMEAVNRYLESLHLDGRRRREQHDETNRRLRHQEDLLEQIANGQAGANGSLQRLLSTQRAAPVRNGGTRAA